MFDYDPYFSAYPQNVNLYFPESDLVENDKLKALGWDKEYIYYKFNQYGFRSEEFQPDNNICFLGCSITFGASLNIEDTFSHIVSTELQMNNCNLGKGGGSMDTVFRIASYWLPKLRPKITVIVSTGKERSEYYDTNLKRHQPLLPNMHNDDSWYLNYLRNENNYNVNFLKNKYALYELCKEIDTSLIWIDHSEGFGQKLDLARDLLHPGKKSHRLMAQDILKCIKDKGVR